MNLDAVMDVAKTSEEITDNAVPDPEVLPRICGDYIMVRPVKTETGKTKGGILLPDSTQGDIKYLCNVGRIVAFGPRAYKTKNDAVIDWVEGGLKVGDIVQWERFVGKRIRYRGVNFVLLKDVAIQMVLENATDVDVTANIE